MIATTHDNNEEMFPIVDEQGNITGAATRGECHSGSMLLHPVVHLHVFNSKGEIYLQKRPEWKDIQPGKWDTAVGGHVDLGESVRQALIRETKEELGIDISTLVTTPLSAGVSIPSEGNRKGESGGGASYVFQSKRERELVYPHKLVYDGEITPSAETDGGRFWSMDEITEAIGKGVFTPNFEQELQKLFLPN